MCLATYHEASCFGTNNYNGEIFTSRTEYRSLRLDALAAEQVYQNCMARKDGQVTVTLIVGRRLGSMFGHRVYIFVG